MALFARLHDLVLEQAANHRGELGGEKRDEYPAEYERDLPEFGVSPPLFPSKFDAEVAEEQLKIDSRVCCRSALISSPPTPSPFASSHHLPLPTLHEGVWSRPLC